MSDGLVIEHEYVPYAVDGQRCAGVFCGGAFLAVAAPGYDFASEGELPAGWEGEDGLGELRVGMDVGGYVEVVVLVG